MPKVKKARALHVRIEPALDRQIRLESLARHVKPSAVIRAALVRGLLGGLDDGQSVADPASQGVRT